MSLVVEVGLVGLHGGRASKRYHLIVWDDDLQRRYTWCSRAGRLDVTQRLLRSEAEEQGYTACRNCWPQ